MNQLTKAYKFFTKKEKDLILKKYIDDGFCVFSFEGIETYKHKISGKETKSPKGLPKGWINIDPNNHLKYINTKSHKGFGFIAGDKSNVTVIDIDNMEVYYQMLKKYPKLKNYRTIVTNKGVHLYCKYDKDIITYTNALKSYDKVDIRNDDAITFCPPTQYKLLDGSIATYVDIGGEILPFPKFIKKDLKQYSKSKNIIHNEQNIMFFDDSEKKITYSF